MLDALHRMRTTLSLDDDVQATPPERSRNGLPLLPLRPDGGSVDLPLVNSLRDELAA